MDANAQSAGDEWSELATHPITREVYVITRNNEPIRNSCCTDNEAQLFKWDVNFDTREWLIDVFGGTESPVQPPVADRLEFCASQKGGGMSFSDDGSFLFVTTARFEPNAQVYQGCPAGVDFQESSLIRINLGESPLTIDVLYDTGDLTQVGSTALARMDDGVAFDDVDDALYLGAPNGSGAEEMWRVDLDSSGDVSAITPVFSSGDVITDVQTAFSDQDGDGVVDAIDNCLVTDNPDQANWSNSDYSSEAAGDACDASYDDTNDIVGANDFNTMRDCFGKSIDDESCPAVTNGCKECDHDGNGIVGAEDFNTLRACFGKNEHCM
jgi:hypothetical protein